MTRRFHSIDVLKFILAIIIVFHHFQQVTNTVFEHGMFIVQLKYQKGGAKNTWYKLLCG